MYVYIYIYAYINICIYKYEFPNVSSLLNLLYNITKKLTFEDVSQCVTRCWTAR